MIPNVYNSKYHRELKARMAKLELIAQGAIIAASGAGAVLLACLINQTWS